MGVEPEQQGESETENEASDNWKIKGRVLAAMNDVSRQPPNTEGESAAEIKKSADDGEESAQDEEATAKLAYRIHKIIIEEEPPEHGMQTDGFEIEIAVIPAGSFKDESLELAP
jgi:hypothetical protein